MRLSVIVQFLLLIVLFSGVYTTANKYQAIEKRVRHYDADSERERENIRVLQAEWAFLTNPVRMEKIARDYFQLQALDARQLVALNNIPLRDTMDAQSGDTDIAQQEAPQPAMTAQADATALPPPIALPGLTATPVNDTRGGQE